MLHWMTLVPVAAVCSAGALLTYAEGNKGAWWYSPAFGLLAVASGLLYGEGVRRCSGPQAFAYSLAFDVLVTAVYVVVPVLACGVRFSPAGWVWLAVTVAALIGFKLSAG